ncbi:MAG TPA: HIT family protein [Candidatus Saccharimonadales bacterium]|nr:HIT family protein [Candidatus Saccharimonadales bacterium]
MSEQTIFDKIVAREVPAWVVYEDDQYMAFLTPFANMVGVTVVIPKQNPGAYVFDMDDEAVAGLMRAAKKTAKLLEKGLGASRVALVFEGEAVPYVHAKLYPMHKFNGDRSNLPRQQIFFPVYPGYIDTHDGPQMSDELLAEIQQKIVKATDED